MLKCEGEGKEEKVNMGMRHLLLIQSILLLVITALSWHFYWQASTLRNAIGDYPSLCARFGEAAHEETFIRTGECKVRFKGMIIPAEKWFVMTGK